MQIEEPRIYQLEAIGKYGSGHSQLYGRDLGSIGRIGRPFLQKFADDLRFTEDDGRPPQDAEMDDVTCSTFKTRTPR